MISDFSGDEEGDNCEASNEKIRDDCGDQGKWQE